MAEPILSDEGRETDLLEGYKPEEQRQDQPIELRDFDGSNNNVDLMQQQGEPDATSHERVLLLERTSLVRQWYYLSFNNMVNISLA